MLHRPGSELLRLTPRNNDELLFDGVPWVARAQTEHDAFAEALRGRGVEVLYLRELLVETLAAAPDSAAELLDAALEVQSIGPSLQTSLREQLGALDAAALAEVLVAGLSREELGDGDGLVERMTPPQDFLIAPLPNLLFTRDSSVWLREGVAVTALAMSAHRRDLPPPPALRGHAAPVRRRHRAQRVAGGRRRARAGAGRARDRGRPADIASRRRGVRPAAVRRRRGARRARRPY